MKSNKEVTFPHSRPPESDFILRLSSMKNEMPKKKPTTKELAIKLRDLPPRKDAQGGRANYSNSAPLSIPPPGFIASSRQPDKNR